MAVTYEQLEQLHASPEVKRERERQSRREAHVRAEMAGRTAERERKEAERLAHLNARELNSATRQVVARVLHPECRLSAAAKLVAIAIVDRMKDHFGDGTMIAWPSARDIAERTRLSERTVRSKLKELRVRQLALLCSTRRNGADWTRGARLHLPI